jgi:hypothetical protein
MIINGVRMILELKKYIRIVSIGQNKYNNKN